MPYAGFSLSSFVNCFTWSCVHALVKYFSWPCACEILHKACMPVMSDYERKNAVRMAYNQFLFAHACLGIGRK